MGFSRQECWSGVPLPSYLNMLLVTYIPWRRAWQPTLVLLPGESHEQRSLAGYHPYGHKGSDMTEATEHAGKTYISLQLGKII